MSISRGPTRLAHEASRPVASSSIAAFLIRLIQVFILRSAFPVDR
jgi:hypothetical protein